MTLFRKNSKSTALLIAGSVALFSLGNALLAIAQPPAQTPASGAIPPTRGPREPMPPMVPADTLAAPSTPQKLTGADGFIQRWLILEPIPPMSSPRTPFRLRLRRSIFLTSSPSSRRTATRSPLATLNSAGTRRTPRTTTSTSTSLPEPSANRPPTSSSGPLLSSTLRKR